MKNHQAAKQIGAKKKPLVVSKPTTKHLVTPQSQTQTVPGNNKNTKTLKEIFLDSIRILRINDSAGSSLKRAIEAEQKGFFLKRFTPKYKANQAKLRLITIIDHENDNVINALYRLLHDKELVKELKNKQYVMPKGKIVDADGFLAGYLEFAVYLHNISKAIKAHQKTLDPNDKRNKYDTITVNSIDSALDTIKAAYKEFSTLIGGTELTAAIQKGDNTVITKYYHTAGKQTLAQMQRYVDKPTTGKLDINKTPEGSNPFKDMYNNIKVNKSQVKTTLNTSDMNKQVHAPAKPIIKAPKYRVNPNTTHK